MKSAEVKKVLLQDDNVGWADSRSVPEVIILLYCFPRISTEGELILATSTL